MKAIVSVFAKDARGITAYVTALLADRDINILDITQTILSGYFTMMMLVDLEGAHMEFSDINAAFDPVRADLGMDIHMQWMDIFDAMHRI